MILRTSLEISVFKVWESFEESSAQSHFHSRNSKTVEFSWKTQGNENVAEEILYIIAHVRFFDIPSRFEVMSETN